MEEPFLGCRLIPLPCEPVLVCRLQATVIGYNLQSAEVFREHLASVLDVLTAVLSEKTRFIDPCLDHSSLPPPSIISGAKAVMGGRKEVSDGRTTTNKSLIRALLGTFLLVQQEGFGFS